MAVRHHGGRIMLIHGVVHGLQLLGHAGNMHWPFQGRAASQGSGHLPEACWTIVAESFRVFLCFRRAASGKDSGQFCNGIAWGMRGATLVFSHSVGILRRAVPDSKLRGHVRMNRCRRCCNDTRDCCWADTHGHLRNSRRNHPRRRLPRGNLCGW